MSRGPISDLAVVAARAEQYLALRDVLDDWVRLGLTTSVTLVNVDALKDGEVRIPCTVLEENGVRGAVLQEELAARVSTRVVRVVAVSESSSQLSTVSDRLALDLVAQVNASLPTVDLVRIHLITTVVDAARPFTGIDDLAWLGWHNVIVAPESAQSPTAGVSPIVRQAGDPTQTLQLAGCLCSLAGLWSAQQSAPLDERPVAPGQSFLAARSFTRHLSTAAVESELLTKLADLSLGYPLPLVDGSAAEIIDDEVGAVTSMAQALENKHHYVFAGARAQARTVPQQPIKVGQLLRMLFSFLGQAIRNAPRAFADRVLYEASAGTAAAVNRAVFGGTDPAFKVVVGGIGPDGRPASWDQFDQALAQVDARAEGRADVVHLAPADLSALWRDFLSSGMTLLDAGTRADGLAPQEIGSSKAVIVDPGRVAPDPSIQFVVSSEVAPYINRDRVEPADVLGARDVYHQLETLPERAPHLVANAGKVKQDLQTFFDEKARTFTGRFGYRIFEDITRCRTELKSYDDQMKALQSQTEASDDVYRQQQRLARTLKIILVAAVGIGVAAVVLAVLGVIGLSVMAAVLVVTFLGWLATSGVVFVKGQTALFALIHRRQQLADAEEALLANAAAARSDLRRLGRAYRQYLDWARAFGTFVHAPLGYPEVGAVADLLIGSRFPKNHRFGSARPDSATINRSAARLRHDLFQVGWLSAAWDAFVDDLPDLGSDGYRLSESRELLFTDPPITQRSLLTTWSEVVAARRWEGTPGVLEGRVSEVLGTTGQDLRAALLSDVETRDPVSGALVRTSLEEFNGGLDAAVDDSGHMFLRATFSSSAQSIEPWRVAETVPDSSGSDANHVVVVTQFSRGFSSHDLIRANESSAATAAPTHPADSDVVDTPVERPQM
ncbi:hypothetical protein [Nocardioides sp. URHA0032]|uniref:hypothetical protein n=1 Tax=Nocardioides sp. URHA0032 TaxID=1380388 RepID=UPI00048AD31C|nr:hypothetical protein [Nocardioides sp. URHA0032]